ncbi:helix-turn-helix domain-containing protein [Streptomyces sp. ISL-98]|nr:helix-turn-helix domain-containing protein [Streptomyces sp. ISL-98]
MGISRATASKWVNRYRRYGELGLLDRPSAPHRQPTATPGRLVVWSSGRLVDRIERMRRKRKWSASRIAFELEQDGTPVSRRTVTRLLAQLGLNRRHFIDPNGATNREPQQIIAERPGHMIHIDVKKVGRIPNGGGRRVHGRGSPQAKPVDRMKTRGTGRLRLPALLAIRAIPDSHGSHAIRSITSCHGADVMGHRHRRGEREECRSGSVRCPCGNRRRSPPCGAGSGALARAVGRVAAYGLPLPYTPRYTESNPTSTMSADQVAMALSAAASGHSAPSWSEDLRA